MLALQGGFFKLRAHDTEDIIYLNDCNAVIKGDDGFSRALENRQRMAFDKLCDMLIEDLKLKFEASTLQGNAVLKIRSRNINEPEFLPVSIHPQRLSD